MRSASEAGRVSVSLIQPFSLLGVTFYPGSKGRRLKGGDSQPRPERASQDCPPGASLNRSSTLGPSLCRTLNIQMTAASSVDKRDSYNRVARKQTLTIS